MNIVYQTDVEVTNVDHNRVVTGSVVDFRPKRRLIVNVSGSEIVLNYESKFDRYYGTSAGLEFISNGPHEIATYREARR